MPFEFESHSDLESIKRLIPGRVQGTFTVKCPVGSYCGDNYGYYRNINFGNFHFINGESTPNGYLLSYGYEDCGGLDPLDIIARITVKENSCASVTEAECYQTCNINKFLTYRVAGVNKELTLEVFYEVEIKITPVPTWTRQGADNWNFNKILLDDKIKESKFFFSAGHSYNPFVSSTKVYYSADIEISAKLNVRIKKPDDLKNSDIEISESEIQKFKHCFEKNDIDTQNFTVANADAFLDLNPLYKSVLNDKNSIEKEVKSITEDNQSFQDALTSSIKNRIETVLSGWRERIRSTAPDSPGLYGPAGGFTSGLSSNHMAINGFPTQVLKEKRKFPYQVKGKIKLNGNYNIKMSVSKTSSESCCEARLKYNKSASPSEPIEITLH